MNDAAGFAFAMGILFSAVAFFYLAYVLVLRLFGKKADGTCSGYELNNNDNAPYGATPALISFSDEKGKLHTEKYRLVNPLKPFKMGQKLTVYYSPKNISKFIVWDISLVITFLLAAAGGGFFLYCGFKS